MATFNDIQLLRITYLRGPSVWTYRPILEVWLDLGELEDWPSNKIPGLNERLTAWLPALIEHHCGVGERGGFIQRLEGGTWMGHVLEHIVIELLNLAGMPAEFGQTREISRRGVYRMVFRCPEGGCGAHSARLGPQAADGGHQRPALRRQAGHPGHQDQHQRQLPGPQHRQHRGRGGRAPHPAHPPQRRQPGATGLRRGAAPHLDGRERPDQRHRRRHRPGQGLHQAPAAGRLRRAGARRPRGRRRPGGLGRSRRTSVFPSPSSRRTATTHAA